MNGSKHGTTAEEKHITASFSESEHIKVKLDIG